MPADIMTMRPGDERYGYRHEKLHRRAFEFRSGMIIEESPSLYSSRTRHIRCERMTLRPPRHGYEPRRAAAGRRFVDITDT